MTATIFDDLIVEPVAIGPSWKRRADWNGLSPIDEFILPELTLGWQILVWIKKNLLDDEGRPFSLTREQSRLILWWYAIDESGRFLYREGVLQRLKGWGKDPFAAVLSAVEFVGPCRFAGWATKDAPEYGLKKGDPVAKGHPRAWIQIAAVSIAQTVNTMSLFPGLFTPECIAEHGIDIGKETIYAYHGQRKIVAVTSSPRTLEGGRPTLVIKNETHHWLKNNDGHAMADVVERNATKSKDGASRVLSITNAYEPSENSVAQREREAWEDENSGLTVDTGVFYDSLEAPPDARFVPVMPDDEEGNKVKPTDAEIKAYIGAIIRAVRGDSTWLNVDRITASILDKKNPPSRSRRFYYNQIVAAEDAWAAPAAVDAAINPFAKKQRIEGSDMLRAGWSLVMADEPIVMFFDGSKSDDSTAIVACRLSDGYIFTIGVWNKPPGKRGEGWLAPREEISRRVDEAFKRFHIVAFWGDPSHTKDDVDGSRYWDDVLDSWMRKYKDRLDVKHWPIKSGPSVHAITWDMASPANYKLFVGASDEFIEQLEALNDIEEYAPNFEIDGHPELVAHMKHARRLPVPGVGISLMKDGRESPRKIDLAVCAVGARMLRRVVLNQGVEEKKRTGKVW